MRIYRTTLTIMIGCSDLSRIEIRLQHPADLAAGDDLIEGRQGMMSAVSGIPHRIMLNSRPVSVLRTKCGLASSNRASHYLN
jgi:hypothetical protein